MRRRLLGITVLLLIALAMNPLIAWGCMALNHRFGWSDGIGVNINEGSGRARRIWVQAFGPSNFIDPRDADGHPITMWPGSHWEGTNQFLIDETIWQQFGYSHIRIDDQLRAYGSDFGQPSIDLLVAGWPASCLMTIDVNAPNAPPGPRPRDGVQIAMTDHSGFRTELTIPIRPIWSGIVINALLYVATALMLYFCLVAGPRMLRRWRGRCAQCGYDMRGSRNGVCPECGSISSAGAPTPI